MLSAGNRAGRWLGDWVHAGASLVELYTGLAYGGPALLSRLKRELAALLQRDGFACVGDAVGADHQAKR